MVVGQIRRKMSNKSFLLRILVHVTCGWQLRQHKIIRTYRRTWGAPGRRCRPARRRRSGRTRHSRECSGGRGNSVISVWRRRRPLAQRSPCPRRTPGCRSSWWSWNTGHSSQRPLARPSHCAHNERLSRDLGRRGQVVRRQVLLRDSGVRHLPPRHGARTCLENQRRSLRTTCRF